MNPTSFNYWLVPGTYIAPSHQDAPFHTPADLGKVAGMGDSPGSPIYGHFPTSLHHPAYYPQAVDEPIPFSSYAMPMTPPEFGSDHDSPYCSPQATHPTEPAFTPSLRTALTARAHTTSGRRRAQNRAAQRAFRERKEKHARDFESQLCALTEKYNKLELSHSALSGAYEKLRKTIELLTHDDNNAGSEANANDADGMIRCRRNGDADTLRKLLDILHGDPPLGSPCKTGE